MQCLHFPTEQTGECGARIAERIDALTPPDGDGGAPDGGDTHRKAPPRSAAAADREMARALRGMMGVGPTAIPTIGVETAPNIAPKVGPDLSAFPSARHFRSWLGLAPGTRFGSGRTLPGRALRMAAVSARKSRTPAAPGTARASSAGTGLSRSAPPRAGPRFRAAPW